VDHMIGPAQSRHEITVATASLPTGSANPTNSSHDPRNTP
jgi:hypothetical protein